MTERLPAPLALRYLHELSTDVGAGVVVAADGALLAGEPALHTAARRLLESEAAAGPGAAAEADGTVILAARDARHGVAIACGRHVLTPLALHDLRAVLAALGDDAGAPDLAPHRG